MPIQPEDLQLRIHVTDGGGIFGGIRDVQHDVARLARIAHRLLTAPERAIGEPIPHLREKPAERIAGAAQAAQQARAVAEARRVPEHQRIAAVGLDQHVALGNFRDVRTVGDFTDVLPKQRARDRCLAGVGV